MKVLIGISLIVVCFKLGRYRAEITPHLNRPELFRNEIAFSLLNLAIIFTFIGGVWLIISGL